MLDDDQPTTEQIDAALVADERRADMQRPTTKPITNLRAWTKKTEREFTEIERIARATERRALAGEESRNPLLFSVTTHETPARAFTSQLRRRPREGAPAREADVRVLSVGERRSARFAIAHAGDVDAEDDELLASFDEPAEPAPMRAAVHVPPKAGITSVRGASGTPTTRTDGELNLRALSPLSGSQVAIIAIIAVVLTAGVLSIGFVRQTMRDKKRGSESKDILDEN